MLEPVTAPCQQCSVELAGDNPELRLELTGVRTLTQVLDSSTAPFSNSVLIRFCSGSALVVIAAFASVARVARRRPACPRCVRLSDSRQRCHVSFGSSLSCEELLDLGYDGFWVVDPGVVACSGDSDEAEVRVGRDESFTLLGRSEGVVFRPEEKRRRRQRLPALAED